MDFRYTQTTSVPAHPCWNCQQENDNATGTKGRGPIPGDFSVCFYCGAIGRYDADLRIQPLTAEDQAYLSKDPAQWALIQRMSKVRDLARRTKDRNN